MVVHLAIPNDDSKVCLGSCSNVCTWEIEEARKTPTYIWMVREHVKGYSNKGHAWYLTYVVLYITNVKWKYVHLYKP